MRYLFLAVLLSGCANVHEAAWEGDKVKFCSPSFWAKQTDFDKAAGQRCGEGKYKAVSGGTEGTGDYTVSNSNINSSKTRCVVYECMK